VLMDQSFLRFFLKVSPVIFHRATPFSPVEIQLSSFRENNFPASLSAGFSLFWLWGRLLERHHAVLTVCHYFVSLPFSGALL